MYKNALIRLESLINLIESNKSVKNYSPVDELENIVTECQKVTKVWTDMLTGLTQDYALKRYVRFQQQLLLELSNRVYSWLQPGFSNDEIAGSENSLFDISTQLIKLNEFLVNYFTAYIDLNSNIPQASLADARRTLRRETEMLREQMEAIPLDAELKLCLEQYIQELVREENRFSYRSWEYGMNLTENMNAMLFMAQETDLDSRVAETLLYLNFNHHCFFQWYQNRVRKSLLSAERRKRIPLLFAQLSNIQSSTVNLTSACDPDLPPVNVLLENWISEMIRREDGAYLSLLIKDGKLGVTLPVPHIGLLVKLFYEEGAFTMRNVTALLRLFSKYFTSKRQENISAESLRKSFYSKDEFTASAVRDMLLKMINRINRVYLSGEVVR